MTVPKRAHYTYTFHVPNTQEYADLNRLLQSSPYPGGIRDRSKFVREVLMDALGLRQRPWLHGAGQAAPAPTATKPEPEPQPVAASATPKRELTPEAENVLRRGLKNLRVWEDDTDA